MLATKTVRRGWLSLAILGAFALTSLVGCGGVKRVPVSGTVTLDGQPVNGGYLEFTPDAAKGNTAKIVGFCPIKEGRYTLETKGVTRAESGAGVPPGWYKVTFRMLDETTKKRRVEAIDVNDKFRSADKTPLAVEVKDKPEPGAYDIKFTK